MNSGHWIGFAVDFEEKLFAFLDSVYDEDSAWHLPVKNRLVSVLFYFSFLIHTNLSLKLAFHFCS